MKCLALDTEVTERFLISSAFLFLSVAFPVAANAKPIKSIAGWDLYRSADACSLGRLASKSFVFITWTAEGEHRLRVHDPQLQVEQDVPNSTSAIIDGKRFEVTAKGARTSDGVPGLLFFDASELIAAARSKETFGLVVNGHNEVTITLNGLAEAFSDFARCAGNLTKRVPEMVPVVAAKLVQSPWLSREELPSLGNSRNELTFRLTITKEGAPDKCDVIESSGSQTLDEAACHLLRMRSRFTPALNASGKPVPSTYQSSVRF